MFGTEPVYLGMIEDPWFVVCHNGGLVNVVGVKYNLYCLLSSYSTEVSNGVTSDEPYMENGFNYYTN